MTDITAERLGKYEILDVLGKGGFGTVYRARDSVLDCDVALKVLDPDKAREPVFVQRFLQEARVTAKLYHAHIASLYEANQIADRHIIALRYIPGKNLQHRLEAGELLSLDAIAAIVEQIGAALDYAHAQDVVHRDIKPSNIIFDDEGRATLTDFGIVKALDLTTDALTMTSTGAVLGTPYYVSPEQANSKPLDGRSDLYSLGVVIYQLITGSVPFEADSIPSLFHKIVYEPLRPPSEVNARASGPIEEVLLKALAKAPDDRYPTGAAFAYALKDAVMRAKDEWAAALYREAKALCSKRAYDEAEARLVKVLAVVEGHQQALSLLQEVRRARQMDREYTELMVLRKDLEAKVQAFRKAYPEARDTEPVFGEEPPKQTTVVQTEPSRAQLAALKKAELVAKQAQDDLSSVRAQLKTYQLIALWAVAGGICLALIAGSLTGFQQRYFEVSDLRVYDAVNWQNSLLALSIGVMALGLIMLFGAKRPESS